MVAKANHPPSLCLACQLVSAMFQWFPPPGHHSSFSHRYKFRISSLPSAVHRMQKSKTTISNNSHSPVWRGTFSPPETPLLIKFKVESNGGINMQGNMWFPFACQHDNILSNRTWLLSFSEMLVKEGRKFICRASGGGAFLARKSISKFGCWIFTGPTEIAWN